MANPATLAESARPIPEDCVDRADDRLTPEQRLDQLATELLPRLTEAIGPTDISGEPLLLRCYTAGIAVRLTTTFGHIAARAKLPTLAPTFRSDDAVRLLTEALLQQWRTLAPVGAAGTTIARLWRSEHRFKAEKADGFEPVTLELAPGCQIRHTSAGIPLLHRTAPNSSHFISLAIAKGWVRIVADKPATTE